VVAGGEHIRAQLKQIVGDLRRDAEAAGGVLGVDDNQIDIVRGDYVADVLAYDPAACASEDVANKKNVQKTAPSF
jgi:hypothetical protein